MRHRLFIASTALWSGLLAAALAWASIHSGPAPSRRTSHASARINGLPIEHVFWKGASGPEAFQDLLSDWMAQGWEPAAPGIDWAAALLNLEQEESLLTAAVRVHVLKRGDRLRMLALLDREAGADAWSSEFPLQGRRVEVDPRTGWALPLRPPGAANRVLSIQVPGLRFGQWQEPRGNAPFDSYAASQGFQARPLPDACHSWWLTGHGARLWARVVDRGAMREIQLIHLER